MILKALIVLMQEDSTLYLRLGDQIYARQAEDKITPPYAVLNRIGRTGFDSLDGKSTLARRRIQIDIYAHSEAEMVDIANRTRDVLCAVAHRDVVVSDESPQRTVRVQAISIADDRDLPEEAGFKRLFRRSMDFFVSHNE